METDNDMVSIPIDDEPIPLQPNQPSNHSTDGERGAELRPMINTMSTGRLSQRNLMSLSVVDRIVPVTLDFENIRYEVDVSKKRLCCNPPAEMKTILNGINGSIKPGTLVAIMGPSGSGKTTLLNVLANRILEDKTSVLSGSIRINGHERGSLGSSFARLAAFVQQDDVLFSHQTVRETLLTAARFRLPSSTTLEERQHRVDGLIQELGLGKTRDTRVGNERVRGVSGGERKRTNIGVELVQDPPLLFLDEPTSGLDSFQALNVVETLKVLCEAGRTIVMSIHQPRSSIFQMFDHLILLSEGKVVYNGEAGQTAVKYFTRLGYECPTHFNPADYFLDIVSIDIRAKELEEASVERIAMLDESYTNHVKSHPFDKYRGNESLEALTQEDSIRSSWCDQFTILATRNTTQILRDKFSLGIRLFMTVFFAVFLIVLYNETDLSQKSIQDRMGILFFIAINQTFGPVMNAVTLFAIEKGIVMRERQAKSYHLSAYYSSKLLTSIPIELIFPLVFACILYWAVGLKPEAAAFAKFIVAVGVTGFTALALGLTIASIAPSVEAANAMTPLFIVLQILFGGFYINSANIPVWINWLQNLSIIKWSFMAFSINEFADRKFTCEFQDKSSCLHNGNQVLRNLSFDGRSFWYPIQWLAVLGGAYHLLAYCILKLNRTKYLQLKANTKASPDS